MKNISRTLIIGLGGTGQLVIRDIKKRLFQRYGEIPPLVKFLCFDSDNDDYQDTPFKYYYDGENRETKKYNLQRDEFRRIGRASVETLKEDPICRNLNFNELAVVYGLNNGISANGFRVDRAFFLYSSGEIMSMLNEAVCELRIVNLLETDRAAKGYHVANNNITVYVIASLAGGFGSSSIMDISRMLQHAGVHVPPMGTQMCSDRIYGMFFTPSFFKDKPNTPFIHMNAYVALSELDHTLGLNDAIQYPPGCIEHENDQNDYEGYGYYMRVRYSSVFLISAETKKGRFQTVHEASGKVASFIASSIALNDGIHETTYINSSHCFQQVEGKRQLYSGLGYCEIRFNRQGFVNYLINQILRDALRAFQYGVKNLELIEFVQDLDLYKMANAIYKLDNERFASIKMGVVEPGRDAVVCLENNKREYLERITAEANRTVEEFTEKGQALLERFSRLLKEQQTQKGFSQWKGFVLQLRSDLEERKLWFDHDLAGCDEQLKQKELELVRLLDEVERSSSIFGRGRQRAAIDQYISSVEGTEIGHLAGLILDKVRKAEVVRIFDEIIRIFDVLRSEDEIQKTFDDMLRLVDSEIGAYRPMKRPDTTVFADDYFLDYFKAHKEEAFVITESTINAALERYFAQILRTGPEVNEQLLDDMRRFVLQQLPDDAMINRIYHHQLTIDELFVHCFGKACDIEDDHDIQRYPHLKLFMQMDSLFDVMWQYEDIKIEEKMLPVTRNVVVGVCDIHNHLLDQNNGYGMYLPTNSYQFINLGDPDRIVFLLQEKAIPAFKLREMVLCYKEFNKKKRTTYAFSDKRLEDIDMIMPESLNEEAEIAWAYGWMLGLIISVNSRIQVKLSANYRNRQYLAISEDGYYDCFMRPNRTDIYACHQKFIKGDFELSKDIYEQAMTQLVRDPIGNAEKIKEWVNEGMMWSPEVRGKQRSSMTDKELSVIQNEVKYLAMRFDKLGLSLNECGMAI